MKDLVKMAETLIKTGDEFIEAQGVQEFHYKAEELLHQAKLQDHYDFKQLVETTFSDQFNSYQNYASMQFSDLPITLAHGNHCFLDLYFWRRRPTVIHDHHFVGAFQCLEGSNVDLEFEFIKNQKLGEFHDLGELNLLQTRLLKKGDVAKIDLLDKFIHQNHHQADLTINVCFRTPDIGTNNLSNFLYSGLRFEKDSELLNRVSRLMSFIHLGDFDVKKLNLSVDDALCFLIKSYRMQSSGKRFMEVKNFLLKKVQDELQVDILSLLDQHESQMDQIENQYE